MAPVALGDHEAAVDELSQVHARGGGRDARLRREHAGGQLAAIGQRAQHAGAARVADEGAHCREVGVPGHAPRVAARRFVPRRSLAVLRSSDDLPAPHAHARRHVRRDVPRPARRDGRQRRAAAPARRSGRRRRQPAVDRRRLRRRPRVADAAVRRPRRSPRPQARRARGPRRLRRGVAGGRARPAGRRCSSPGASCRARAPRSCCPARWPSSRARTRTRSQRARAIGIWAAISSLALPAGVIAGGALVDGPGWRWAFLVNLPVVAVALPVTARVVRRVAETDARAPDVPGAALTAALLATVTFAIIAGSPAAGVAAAALLAALVAVERRRPDPMLPAALFRRPTFAAANAVGAAMNLGTLGTLFVLTLFLQDVQGRSALGAGRGDPARLRAAEPSWPRCPGRLVGRIGPRPPMVAGLLDRSRRAHPAGRRRAARPRRCSGASGSACSPPPWSPPPWARSSPTARAWPPRSTTPRARPAARSASPRRARWPAAPARAGFVHGFHAVALGAAALYVAAAALAWAALPSRERASARRMASSSASG